MAAIPVAPDTLIDIDRFDRDKEKTMERIHRNDRVEHQRTADGPVAGFLPAVALGDLGPRELLPERRSRPRPTIPTGQKTATLFALLFLLLAWPSSVLAVTSLGTGTGALLGGDLTDPEDDIDDTVSGGANFNWLSASASSEAHFSPALGHEAAFDVFDNKVSSGEAKWCCSPAPEHVAVEFDHAYQLTHFTIAAGNDSVGRDPTVWYIEGSNDGSNWTTIFEYDEPGVPPFSSRLEVLRYDVSVDFLPPAFYTHFRYRVEETNGANAHQINEIELFGTPSRQLSVALTGDGTIEEFYLNGQLISLPDGHAWTRADQLDLLLEPGKNVLAAKVTNNHNEAGFIADMFIEGYWAGTSEAWKVSTTDPGAGWAEVDFDDSDWNWAEVYGEYGAQPWGTGVSNISTNSPAEWIWSSEMLLDSEVYFRYEIEPHPFQEMTAIYNRVLGAPECAEFSSVCSSGDSLISRGEIEGITEPNQPNTIDGCSDSPWGTYQVDDSVERISVKSVDTAQLTEGGHTEIEVEVWGHADITINFLHVLHAADASNPDWTYVDSVILEANGPETVSMPFTLPEGGSRQAIRAVFGYVPGSAPCPTHVSPYGEADDLVFAVRSRDFSDGDGDGVDDAHEHMFCEDDPTATCAQLSHQFRLGHLLIFNEELSADVFADWHNYYLSTGQTELDSCHTMMDLWTFFADFWFGLHPPDVEATKNQVCQWNSEFDSDRRRVESDPAHCNLEENASYTAGLMATAEKAVNEGDVCRAFNFLAEAGGIVTEILGEEYNFRFQSLLESTVFSEVFTPETAKSLKVILDSMFPEQMCELNANSLYEEMVQQMLDIAETYLDSATKDALSNDHWSGDRQDAIGSNFDSDVPEGYAKRDELKKSANRCESQAVAKARNLANVYPRLLGSARGRLLLSLRQSIAYNLCIVPELMAAVKPDDSIFEPQLQQALDHAEDSINQKIDNFNTELANLGEDVALPSWNFAVESHLAPLELFYLEDSVKPGFLDFSSGSVLPTVVTTPTLHCDANPPYSDLIETSDETEAAIRPDCVTVRHDGTQFDLFEDNCSIEVPILCDVSDMVFDPELREETTQIGSYFITDRSYRLADADEACSAEYALDMDIDQLQTAFAASDLMEDPNGAIANMDALDTSVIYGTGFVVCTEEDLDPDNDPNNSTLSKGVDPVQCATGPGRTTRSSRKRAGADAEPLLTLPDTRRSPLKRLRDINQNEELGEAISGVRDRMREELEKHPGATLLNHFTLPIGQGSCHIMQCLEVPEMDANGEVGDFTINNVVYDCGSDSRIPERDAPTFVEWIVENLEGTGSRLLANTILEKLGNSSTDYVISSHTDNDHNSMLNDIWQDDAKIPENWTLGGRPEDFHYAPLQAMLRRLESGSDVVLNGSTLTPETIVLGVDEILGEGRMTLARLERIQENATQLTETRTDGLVGGVLNACGATMRLLTVNADILGPDDPAHGNEQRLNSVSAVVTLEVPDQFLAILPGDGVQETWTSAMTNAAGTPVSPADIDDFEVRYLASAHHGSFRYGSNDSVVDGYVQPTHVVFSHALLHNHVHNSSWHAYWNSVASGAVLTAGPLYMKDSKQGNAAEEDGSPTDASQDIASPTWTDNLGGPWSYKPNLTNLHGKALLSTYSNGLIWASVLRPPIDPSAGTAPPSTFTLRRLRIDPLRILTDIGTTLYAVELNNASEGE